MLSIVHATYEALNHTAWMHRLVRVSVLLDAGECFLLSFGHHSDTLIFLFLLKKINCGYSLEPPRRGGSNEYPQSMFLSRNMKTTRIFLLKGFIFLVVNF